jgi:hypothetical protein
MWLTDRQSDSGILASRVRFGEKRHGDARICGLQTRGAPRTMNEWGFASEISKWWEAEFRVHPEWNLRSARVEEVVPGSRQRSDLVVSSDQRVICGEIRLPDHPQSAPWDLGNLTDATHKALSHGCRWAFTSDANILLLIDTQKPGALITKIVHQVEAGHFNRRQELDDPAILASVRAQWIKTIAELAPVLTGASAPPGMPADELFVNALRELLSAPVSAIRDALNRRRASEPKFEMALLRWMVDDQGWSHDPAKWDQEIILSARLTAYVFATRLLFYSALRRSKPTLTPLAIPTSSAFVASMALKALFQEAREISGDYETLFDWDRVCDYALLDVSCLPLWQRVIDHISIFDVSTIDHDILGRLFERLIEPHERYEWGQHYTASDIVDLMLSFAIPDGHGIVLDPAVGGGTFLVRAYARKRALNSQTSHQDRLTQLFGTDISGFAATIATVNLAIRHLDFSDNYPRIATRSFFRVNPDTEFARLPGPANSVSGMRSDLSVTVGRVRAVVGNPPYIRLHKLGDERQKEARRILGRGDRSRAPSKLGRLANYHVYFWFHAAQFLEPGGRIALLTAGEWMDSDYGAALQEWLLNNFCIEAFIESGAEAWFSEARVGTVVTIIRQSSNEVERGANLVRFVRLRRALRDLYGDEQSELAHLTQVDLLRDRILSLAGVGETDDMDWSTITQNDLCVLGSAPATKGATPAPVEPETC